MVNPDGLKYKCETGELYEARDGKWVFKKQLKGCTKGNQFCDDACPKLRHLNDVGIHFE